ncbi:MAG: type II secretion system protein [Tenericutes bacterium]|nr:type II secretion system protein [Mycoplasmatota bacterium]
MNKNIVKSIHKNNMGLTLIELIAAIVILGIIAAIATFSIGSLISNVREDVQIINMQHINTYISDQISINEIDDEALYTYKRSGAAGDEYFSTFLEKTWEVANGPGDDDNTNILNITNSLSQKTGVVNWTDAPGLGDDLYCNQSLYITTDSDASYIIDNPETIDMCYAGSIVIWYNKTDADKIIIYFVDNDGLQSDLYFIYEKDDE